MYSRLLAPGALRIAEATIAIRLQTCTNLYTTSIEENAGSLSLLIFKADNYATERCCKACCASAIPATTRWANRSLIGMMTFPAGYSLARTAPQPASAS